MPSATYRATDFSAAAEVMGLDLVVVSEHRQAMSYSMDWRALQVDLCDPEGAASAIVALAADHPLDAVVAVDDQGVETAARAAASLGLSASPVAAVQLTRDKIGMRQSLAAAGVAQPRYAVLGGGDDPEAAWGRSGLAWPLVVKPVGLSASRGVIRVDDPEALRQAIGRIRAILGEEVGAEASELLLEEFVPGPEVAVEGVVRAGQLEIVAIFDKPDPLDGPYFEETLYVTPSRAGAGDLGAVEELVTKAVGALGLTHGPIHAEARLGPEGPRLLEVAARSIGGLCSRALRFGAGVSLEQLILAAAVGVELGELAPTRSASGVMMIPIPAAGRLREVHGVAASREVPNVSGVEITVPLGSLVQPLPEGDRYLGFLFAAADTPGEVEEALRAGHHQLRFVIESSPVAA